MIRFTTGDVLGADVEAIVNTVNTVGVMGKGIALQFKKRFPDNFKAYEKAYRHDELRTGKMFVFETGQAFNPKYIINFPTKSHWRGKTKPEYITEGLADLVRVMKERKIRSIAIPPLGCGNGGLSWSTVRPMIEAALAELEQVDVAVYEPQGAPNPEAQPVADKVPQMTPGRAALVGLMEQYLIPGYRFTRIEIQKLAYLLQEAGEPLRLTFGKNQFGPYANNLNHVLQHMDGHYIQGYGDRTTNEKITLLHGATELAHRHLDSNRETTDRLEKVRQLIEGYETPYGMELLATTHWLVRHDRATTLDNVLAGFRLWPDKDGRKAKLFKPNHIEKAYRRLQQQGWI